ncbi:MAG: hypothetical protein JSU77_07400 [Fidelibacterota bacterium]|nr:MAG: hypothetical protein JSU77_07400 [Candidatus Neomarinimicrobiota bacterium]
MKTLAHPPGRLLLGLGCLQLFIGIGAVAGGVGLVSAPDGSALGLPLELLEHSPFPDYFIPGLVLLIVNGLGSLAGGIITLRRSRMAAEVAIALGTFLVLWIVVQIAIIRSVHWLHVLYFIIGLIETWLGLRLRRVAAG